MDTKQRIKSLLSDCVKVVRCATHMNALASMNVSADAVVRDRIIKEMGAEAFIRSPGAVRITQHKSPEGDVVTITGECMVVTDPDTLVDGLTNIVHLCVMDHITEHDERTRQEIKAKMRESLLSLLK